MPLEFVSTDWQNWEEQEKSKIIEQIASSLPPDIYSTYRDRDTLEKIIRQAVLNRTDLVAPHEVDDIVSVIMGQATGYGVLQEFFLPGAEEVTEVFVNPSQDGVPKVFYGKHGRPWPAGKTYFRNNDEALRYFQKICDDAGRPLTMESPIQDVWLKDGTRVAVVAFGASPFGPSATFRKSPVTRPPMPLERLVENGMLPGFAAEMLVDLLVAGHANIGIFGRTDSGKTTFMRGLGLYIEPLERTFIAETSFELHLPNLKNVVNLVEVSVGDRIIVDMAALVKTMNRNNPDRAILGEIRSKEIIAASQMASSTSGGFWTTGHAGDVNSLRTRLWGMFMDGGIALPKEFLDEIIASMFHFLIFLDKETITEERRRTLMEVVEVSPEGYRTIIRFDAQEFAASGGKTRRWIYENPVSPERLAMLAFRGAKVKP
ncbi:MAG: CpaF/VirB11 family protein, partial [Peptococcaceae bacterium]|nr:CpaF/VirB11 family protein [Peptococcaceae bacterium]